MIIRMILWFQADRTPTGGRVADRRHALLEELPPSDASARLRLCVGDKWAGGATTAGGCTSAFLLWPDFHPFDPFLPGNKSLTHTQSAAVNRDSSNRSAAKPQTPEECFCSARSRLMFSEQATETPPVQQKKLFITSWDSFNDKVWFLHHLHCASKTEIPT